MKKYLFLVLALVLAISLVGCGNKTENNEVENNKAENNDTESDMSAIDIVGTGINIYNTYSEIMNDGVNAMDAMFAETMNRTFSRYASEKTTGKTVNSFIDYIELTNSENALPIPFEIVYENGLTAENIDVEKYYSIVIEDKLPEGKVDGYLDTATISFVIEGNSTSTPSGEQN